LLKMRRFRSFQISQTMSITIDRKPSLFDLWPQFPNPTNQALSSWLSTQLPGSKPSTLNQCPAFSQIARLYWHSVNRCEVVSRFLMHSGQKYWFGHSLISKRAAVHILFWSISQVKVLCLVLVMSDNA
jgi:hypothetical protein